jgi:hypothetical protein
VIRLSNRRDLKLDEYGISKHRYQELRSFCLQYNEWRDELKYNTDTVKSKGITDMPLSTSDSNATEDLIIKRQELFDKCSIVEQTLIKAIADTYNGEWEDIYPKILKGIVNEGINYNYLDEILNIQCGRNTYYKIRRYFFYLLSKTKK